MIVAAIAVLFCFTTWNLSDSQFAAQVSFLFWTLLIMISSFGVALWFSWQLRCVDWVEYT